MRVVSLVVFCVLVRLCALTGLGAPVLTEIMFHPAGTPEPQAEEWLEIHNPDPDPVNLSGWKISRGVQFTLPAATVLPPDGYLVIAADVARFQAKHPGSTAAVIGGWTGRLSNSGETIRLENSTGNTVDEVTYADEGDWALRVRGALHFGHRGWDWLSEADGSGRTLERRSTWLPGSSGQNWGSSGAMGGTPGAVNSLAAEDVAPLISEVKHKPDIPRVIDPITISCELHDEGAGATATLHWRNGTGLWQTAQMRDVDKDGDVEATIPEQANLSVIEFYIAATDGALSRTWPAPACTSDPADPVPTFGQVANALLQVDNTFSQSADFTAPGTQPIYRIIMTGEERQELATIGSGFPDADSDARMNATFISHDGTGVKTRYLAGVRNRGNSSRLGPPNNYHVSFPSDDRWNGRTSFQLNARAPHSQALGEALFARAGIATQRTSIVQVRVNGTDAANGTPQMYGRYVLLESLDGDWAEAHYPDDPDGNLYRLDDHDPNPVGNPPGDLGNGEFRYEGENGAAYADTFLKETNQDENDFRDVIEAARIVSAPAASGTAAQPAISDEDYPEEVAKVFDLDDFYTYLATDALIGNQEGGLQTGRFDDVSIYIGVKDKRVKWIPHDLDDVFDIGAEAGNPVTRSIFSYDVNGGGLAGMTRLFRHPELVPRYYAKVLEQMEKWFNAATIDPTVEQIMRGWVPATDGSAPPSNTSMAEIKAYVAARRANVLAQIPQSYSLNVSTAGADTPEGYKLTTNGAATISGTFNVAKTYSIRVNGTAPQVIYRTSGNDLAGTWRLAIPAGGGAVLRPGLNTVNVEFYDQPNGTGNVLQRLTSLVLYGAAPVVRSETLSAPGSLALTAPADYVPGVPILVRVDLKNAAGDLDRKVWNSTATLSASNGLTLTPSSITLYNGVGSALVNIGTGGSTQIPLIGPGGTAAAPAPGAPLWRILDTGGDPGTAWQARNYDDSAWRTGLLHAGGGDDDERTVLANVPGSAQNPRRAFYFRQEFEVTDLAAITALQIRAVIDDGAIFYLNGTEILRDGLPEGPVGMTTPAVANRSGTAERQVRTFNVSAFRHLLLPGRNVLAVAVHNYSSGTTFSADLSFDCELIATKPVTDPGAFTLSASVPGAAQASRHVASLSGVVPAAVSGTLPAGETVWSGLVSMTGDVTVPTGSTLTIRPGTRVLVDGTSAPGNSNGARIIVNGTLAANGTAAQPISITASDPGSRWGQIHFVNAQPASLKWVLLSHAGHSAGAGHTNRGPMLRLAQSNLTLEDTVLSDGPAKAIYSSGTCDLVIRRSLINRMITGPELENGISLLIEDSNIQEILPIFRESNAAAPDDEDCLYVHNTAGRPVLVRRSVFALCGDDVFDCLGGPIAVEDSILRDGWDKGMSLLDNDLTISRTLIVNCDKAIVPKSSQPVLRTTIMDRCTIISEDHDTSMAPWGYTVPPSNADPDTASTGLYTQDKRGQSASGATLAILAKNSIIIAKEPVLVDPLYPAENTSVRYSDLIDTDAPGAAPWPGPGNIASDPLFVHAATGLYGIQSGSPARDRGDPASPSDADGTRADMGAIPYGSGTSTPGVITWSAAAGPYYVADHLKVAKGQTLVIQPGTSVYVAQNKRITVEGRIIAQGTPGKRIKFSHMPGEIAAGDCDPIKNGVQTGPPKWGGLRIVDSMAEENIVSYCD
ncbi:MAG: CotH kinase family protein, partial [Chthoniobacteraceae bacterium]